MQTYDIPEQQWIDFFDDFSREHAGWTTTIEVLDSDTGPQNLAEDLPLEGISFNEKGTRPCAMQISVGDSVDSHVNHVIDTPLHARTLTESDESLDVEIEPAQGPKTLVHLHA